MEMKVNSACLLVQPQQKLQLDYKKKNHQELSENQVVWKPNNQEITEATLIQTSRRGRDVERLEVVWRHGMGSPTPMCGR